MRGLSVLVFALWLAGSSLADEAPVVRGRVLDDQDRPLAGANVELRPVLDPHPESLRLLAGEGRPRPVARARSDREGLFELSAPEIGLWRITVGAEGWVPMTRVLRPLLHEEDLGDVWLLPAEEMAITVVGGDAPQAGALVDARAPGNFEPLRRGWEAGRWWPDRRWAQTGENGRAVLQRAVGEQPEISVRAIGFGPARAKASGSALAISLEPSSERPFEILDAQGKPAGGVLLLDAWRPLGITAKDGSVRLESAYLPSDDPQHEPPRLAISAPAGASGAAWPGPAVLEKCCDTRQALGGGYQAMLSSIAVDQTVLRLPMPSEVSGRVADREGNPIAGVLVWTTRGPIAATMTDARGRFSWLTTSKTLMLGFAAGGYRPHLQRVDVGSEISSDLAVALEPASALAGRVVDEDGMPVGGARVEVRPLGFSSQSWNPRNRSYRATTSRADGGFRWSGMPIGEMLEIRALHDGFAPAAMIAEVAGSEASNLRIVLRRGTTVVGQVVDEDGGVIAGAVVRLSHQPAEGEARLEIATGEYLSAPEAITDESGRFAVRGLPAGEHTARIGREGYASRTLPGVRVEAVPGAADPELDLGTITLADAAPIEARVVDAEGEPISGVRVRIHSRSESGRLVTLPLPRQATLRATDDRGIFRYHDLKAGDRVSLRLEHPDYVRVDVPAFEAPTTEPLEVVMHPGATVAGRVVDAQGRGIARALLQASTEVNVQTRYRSSSASVDTWGHSVADGGFELRGVLPGEVRLSARAEGFAEERVRLQLAEGDVHDDLRIELRRGATVSGQVHDPQGLPVIGIQVSLTHRAGEHNGRGTSATTDGEGRFRIVGRPLGPAEVVARHREHGVARREIEIVPGGNPVELRLAPARQISGRVVDPAGRPVPGARVRLSIHTGSRSWSTSRQLDANGSFVFEPEKPGDYELSAEREGLVRVSMPLTVGEEPISGLELVLRQGATIRGAVSGLRPEERGRIMILARHVPNRSRGETSAIQVRDIRGSIDTQDEYRVAGLYAGTWELQVVLPGSGREARATVEVLAAQSEVIHDLELSGGDLVLTGVVVAGLEPAAQASVSVASAAGSSAGSTTSRDGRFRLEGLEPGTYTLRISSDWGNHEEIVELWSDRDLAVHIELRRIAGRVISGNGEPLAGVALALVEDAAHTGMAPGVDRVSGPTGEFDFPQVHAARYQLMASHEDYASAAVLADTVVADAVGLEVVMNPSVSLMLELRAAGKVPESAQVMAYDAVGRPVAFHDGLVGSAGRLEVTAIPPGSWQLTVLSWETAPARIAVEVPGGPYVVWLEPRTELRVSVPALAEAPEAATLTLLDAAGEAFTPARVGRSAEHWPLLRGEIVLHYLPPGTWSLQVESASGVTWSGVATTRPEVPADVVLQ